MHVYICLCVHICIRVSVLCENLRAYVYVCARVYMCACVCIYVCACVCLHVHMYGCIYAFICVCVFVCVNVHKRLIVSHDHSG